MTVLMYTMNRIGSKTNPWDTPEVTGTDPDSPPSRTTICDRLPRKARIQADPILMKFPQELCVVE